MLDAKKLAERVNAKIDEVDANAIEKMTGGNLRDFAEYRNVAGYRRALRDAKTLIEETLDEIMKE